MKEAKMDAMTENKATVYDICPYIDSYIPEVEQNVGKSIDRGMLKDLLSDFGTFPTGTSYEERDRMIAEAVKGYFGS